LIRPPESAAGIAATLILVAIVHQKVDAILVTCLYPAGGEERTLNQQSEDPETRVMFWENARDKRNSSRAIRVNPVYLS